VCYSCRYTDACPKLERSLAYTTAFSVSSGSASIVASDRTSLLTDYSVLMTAAAPDTTTSLTDTGSDGEGTPIDSGIDGTGAPTESGIDGTGAPTDSESGTDSELVQAAFTATLPAGVTPTYYGRAFSSVGVATQGLIILGTIGDTLWTVAAVRELDWSFALSTLALAPLFGPVDTTCGGATVKAGALDDKTFAIIIHSEWCQLPKISALVLCVVCTHTCMQRALGGQHCDAISQL
jgi:hypothetical protein